MMRGAGLTQTDNAWSNIGEEEQRARDAAVSRANTRAGALDIVISTRARQLADEPPPPDRLVAHDAIRAAETRQEWAQWHLEQARRHRATLAGLVARHEAEAARLGGSM
jgi:hypothetical protein